MSRILRSLGFGLGLETFANFWRVSVSDRENWSCKKSRFWFRKIWSQKKIIGFGFRDLVSEEKYWFRFQKIWSRKKVTVLENLVSEKKYRYHLRLKFWYRYSVLGGAQQVEGLIEVLSQHNHEVAFLFTGCDINFQRIPSISNSLTIAPF